MIRRAVLALLLFLVLLGLGAWGLWSQGWLPSQQATQPGDTPVIAPPADPAPVNSVPVDPVPVRPVPVKPVPVRPVPSAPSAPAPDVTPAPDRVAPAPPVQPMPTPTTPLPEIHVTPPATPAPSRSSPSLASVASLGSVNAVRILAALPAVARTPEWDAQCAAHARYLVKADRGEHREDPASPYRSAAGEACAAGHYFVSSQPASSADRAVMYWATGAFHLPQLIDPRLTRVAFGGAHDGAGGVQSAAVLDVGRGLTGTGKYPVRFPAPGRVSPYTTAASSEWPDPTPSCAGYAAPLGAPVALLLGPGGRATGAAIKVNGRPVAACLLTPESFRGASDGDTQVGQNVLGAQGGAVVLPRRPLPAGADVRVSFSTAAGRVSWAFRVR
ncbi:CAP domain-containing protein [Deinococcus sp.]|uniref:CAP domain-containing protein n=1 Tax=Deinococcus sp. TaxID=47478 RepID=UPI002869B397|nr:CAP domain-containing protein [Deinococcus sp.]